MQAPPAGRRPADGISRDRGLFLRRFPRISDTPSGYGRYSEYGRVSRDMPKLSDQNAYQNVVLADSPRIDCYMCRRVTGLQRARGNRGTEQRIHTSCARSMLVCQCKRNTSAVVALVPRTLGAQSFAIRTRIHILTHCLKLCTSSS